MPKDEFRLPRLPSAALSPKDGSLSPLSRPSLNRRSGRLPAGRLEFTREKLTEQRQEIAALERHLAARRRRSRLLSLRSPGGVRPSALLRNGSPAVAGRQTDPRRHCRRPKRQSPRRPTPEPEQNGHSAPDEEAKDGPQAALTRLFFQEVSRRPAVQAGQPAAPRADECVGHGEEQGRPRQPDRSVRDHHSPRAQDALTWRATTRATARQ